MPINLHNKCIAKDKLQHYNIKRVIKMEKRKYEVRCWHCEHFINYDSKRQNGRCDIKQIILDTCEEICDNFILKRGLYTKLSYPENK